MTQPAKGSVPEAGLSSRPGEAPIVQTTGIPATRPSVADSVPAEPATAWSRPYLTADEIPRSTVRLSPISDIPNQEPARPTRRWRQRSALSYTLKPYIAAGFALLLVI